MAIDTFLGRLARAWREGGALRDAIRSTSPPTGVALDRDSIFPRMTIDIPMPAGVRTPGVRPPIFMADGKPVEFFARDSAGGWSVATPEGGWRPCVPFPRQL
ncbi:MAG: hypothetical protein ACRYHQ_41085 [Janthinobacterium lividum]